MTNLNFNADEFHSFFHEKQIKEREDDGAYLFKTVISNWSISENINIYNDQLTRHTILKDCVFEKDLDLMHISTSSVIEFENCIINGKFHILHSSFDSTIYFNNLKANEFEIQASTFKTGIKFDIINIATKLTFKNISVNHIPIFLNKDDHINELYLVLGPESTADYRINNAKINRLEILGINNKNSIRFNSCVIQKIAIIEFHNGEILELNNISCDVSDGTQFFMRKSSLSKVHFYNIDFNTYSTTIIDCNISEIITNNIVWPKHIFTNWKKVDTTKLREIYRQLKQVTLRQGDIFASLDFKRLEMEAYNNSITWDENFGDKFILSTNRIFNNHGLDWVRTSFWIVGTNFIFLVVIYGFYQPLKCSCDIADVFKSISDFLLFINPLHKDIFDAQHLKGFGLFIDTFSRLTNSYLIFQFLRAFRKLVV